MPLFAADIPVEVIVAIIPVLGGILGFAYWLLQRWITKVESERDAALKEVVELKNGDKYRQLTEAQDRSDRLFKEKVAQQEKYDEDIGERDEQIKMLKEALEKVTQRQAAPQVGVAALQEIKEQEELQKEDAPEKKQDDAAQNGQTGAWVIAPCSAQDTNQFRAVWRFDLEHGVISVGWGELGEIASCDEVQLRMRIDTTYPDASTQARGHYFSMLWKFYHRINVGDVIIARQGTKRIAAVGAVKRRAYYKPNWSPAREHYPDGPQYPNHIDVEWQKAPRDKDFPKAIFGLLTVSHLPEGRFQSLVEKSAVGSAHGVIA